jgi:hypothetical protein
VLLLYIKRHGSDRTWVNRVYGTWGLDRFGRRKAFMPWLIEDRVGMGVCVCVESVFGSNCIVLYWVVEKIIVKLAS